MLIAILAIGIYRAPTHFTGTDETERMQTMNDTENNMEDARRAFLNSFDFMRLGYAISSNNIQAAVMAARGMENSANEAGLPGFVRMLSGIRLAMTSGNSAEALEIMTQLTAVRVKMLNEMSND